VKVTIEMTLDEEMAQRMKDAAKSLAAASLGGNDAALASAVLKRIADDYARKAAVHALDDLPIVERNN
jgi:hypothetical protein